MVHHGRAGGFEARKNRDSVVVDAKRVQTVQGGGTAELDDLDRPLMTRAAQFVSQPKDAVDHGLLWRHGLVRRDAVQQDDGAAQHACEDLQLAHQLLHLLGRARSLRRGDQAIQNKQVGFSGANFAAEQLRYTGQPAILQRIESADVGDLRRNRVGLKEGKLLQVLQHSPVRFGKEGHVGRCASSTHIVKTYLVGEDGLA